MLHGTACAVGDIILFICYGDCFTFAQTYEHCDKNVFKKFLKELGFLFFQKRTAINKNKAVRLIPVFQNSTITLFLHAA